MNVRRRQTRPGGGKLGINRYRAFEHAPTQSDVFPRPFLKEFAASEIKFVGLNVGRRLCDQIAMIARAEGKAQSINHIGRDLVLNRENVGRFAIEPFGPEMVSITSVDEL